MRSFCTSCFIKAASKTNSTDFANTVTNRSIRRFCRIRNFHLILGNSVISFETEIYFFLAVPTCTVDRDLLSMMGFLTRLGYTNVRRIYIDTIKKHVEKRFSRRVGLRDTNEIFIFGKNRPPVCNVLNIP